MSTLPDRVDLLIVGAGTAGAALAGQAARRGLSVLCVDRRALDDAGARWVNGVCRDAFAEADVPLPRGEELRGDDAGFHLLAGRGPERITMRGHGVLDVDMRLLVARLHERARDAGAALQGEVEILALEGRRARTSVGAVEADLVVDASGLAGLGLLPRRVPRADLCAAAQAVHAVADARGAADFLARYAAREGETVCFSGVAGGYSILNVSVHGDEVSLLTGSIPADGHPSGRAMLEGFVAETDWIGARRFGGHRAIPLGRPRDVLAEGHCAAVGDAAGQVFAAHGSGIGAGMTAARILAEEIAGGGGLDGYAVRWMRTHGGRFAAYDVFRRLSQRLTLEELRRLLRSGLLDAESAAAGMGQRLPRVDLARVRAIVPAAWRAGRLSARLAIAGARMAALVAHYARYPHEPSRRARWARRTMQITMQIHGGAQSD